MKKLTLSIEDIFINTECQKRSIVSFTTVKCVSSLLKSVLTLKQRNIVDVHDNISLSLRYNVLEPNVFCMVTNNKYLAYRWGEPYCK
jgi:hypothetical protein